MHSVLHAISAHIPRGWSSGAVWEAKEGDPGLWVCFQSMRSSLRHRDNTVTRESTESFAAVEAISCQSQNEAVLGAPGHEP